MRALPLACLVLTACFLPVRSAGTAPTGGAPAGAYAGATSTGDAASAPASSAPAAPVAEPPATPRTVSVTIRSSCSKTVSVFYGDKPGFSSGTTSSVSSNSVSSRTFTVGDKMWVLTDRGDGASAVTISDGTRNIEIDASCTGMRSG